MVVRRHRRLYVIFLLNAQNAIIFSLDPLHLCSKVKVVKRGSAFRVLDSRPRGRGFEPHRRPCVVVLEQDTFILV